MRTDLYYFNDNGIISTFTSGNRLVSFNGDNYIPTPINRGDILITSSMDKANLDVKISIKNTTAKGWLTSPSNLSINLILYTKTDDEIPVIAWRGRVVNIYVQKQEIALKVDSLFTTLLRSGLRKRFQRTCPYALYDKGCNLDKNNFGVTGNIYAKNGLVVYITEAASQPDGFYTGGIIEDSEGIFHFITKHVGDQLTILKNAVIKTNVNGIIYPGCDRSTSACSAKFDNLDNFGGYPYIPIKNPLGGSSIA